MSVAISSPTIFVVDDDPAIRKGLTRLIGSQGHKVEAYPSAEAWLRRDPYSGAGCLVLDINMEGLNGFELQEKLAGLGSDLPIIFLTGCGDIPMSVRAIRGGAIDFLTKPVDASMLFGAITSALSQHELALISRLENESLNQRFGGLTQREFEIMRCMISGALNKQIAFQLNISEKTVKVHRARVFEKTGVISIAELVRLCSTAGIEPVTIDP